MKIDFYKIVDYTFEDGTYTIRAICLILLTFLFQISIAFFLFPVVVVDDMYFKLLILTAFICCWFIGYLCLGSATCNYSHYYSFCPKRIKKNRRMYATLLWSYFLFSGAIISAIIIMPFILILKLFEVMYNTFYDNDNIFEKTGLKNHSLNKDKNVNIDETLKTTIEKYDTYFSN